MNDKPRRKITKTAKEAKTKQKKKQTIIRIQNAWPSKMIVSQRDDIRIGDTRIKTVVEFDTQIRKRIGIAKYFQKLRKIINRNV